jgi:formylmethanofuran dehydrogenase subunit E
MELGFLYKIGVWLKQTGMLPANLAKVASINKDLELQKQLSETQQRLKEAEERLAKDAAIKTGRMFFHHNVFWAKDENGQIEKSPYCPRCFELDGKAVHLITWYNSGNRVSKCPECKVDGIFFSEPK